MSSQKEELGKTESQYQETIKRLTAIVKGKDNLTPNKKVPKDAISDIVDELILEDVELIKTTAKADLKALLAKFVELNKLVDTEKKKLFKLEEDKKKEFIEAAKSVFSKLDGIVEIERDYYNALNVATGNEINSLDAKKE